MSRSTDPHVRGPTLDPRDDGASDARLVELVRQGNPDAYRPLVERYGRKVMRIALRFVHDNGLAEDIAQEVFLRAYRQLGDFDTSKRFAPWLMRITVNLCVDKLRSRRRRGRLVSWGSRGEPPDQAADPSDHVQRDELRRQVRQVVGQLPLKYRTVLVLRDLEGFSCSEVAAIVRRPEATVRWRLSRARQMFRRRWEQQNADVDEGVVP